MAMDERLRVFLTDPTEVFHSVEHRHEIWKEDPFDVPSVHAEAREAFERLVARATTPSAATSGRILLLLGDAGAGKTHLLRAFRSHVHKNRCGFVGYMQLTSASNNYARYVLSNLIDSLDQPYDEPVDTRTGLVRLAALLASRALDSKLAAMLRDDAELTDDEVSELVTVGADRLLSGAYHDADLDLLRALLFLHRPDPRIKSRIFKYLRCEDISQADQKRIGGITPKTDEGHPAWMIQQLGRILAAGPENPMSLVLCIDQLEGLHDLEAIDALRAPFRRAMTTLGDLAEIPSIIVVLSCLEDAYRTLGPTLHGSLRDRIEHDPDPIRLRGLRSPEEAASIVAERLRYLYTNADVAFDERQPLYPFPPSIVAERAQMRTRDLIEGCRDYRERCKKAGALVDPRPQGPENKPPPDARVKAVERWEQRWNDFLAASNQAPEEEDGGLAPLLAWAVVRAGEELESGHRFETSDGDGAVRVTAFGPDRARSEHLYVALCNRTAQFGWLAKQISQHTKAARGDAKAPVLVLTRNDDFPESKGVTKEIDLALRGGGRRVIIQDAEWRAMLALQRFTELHQKEPFFAEWRMDENHMSRLTAIRDILDLDHVERLGTAAPAVPAPRVSEPEPRFPTPPAPNVVSAGEPSAALVGMTVSLTPKPVQLKTSELTCHSAFLGGSGSGKTTVALSVIEQILVSGVPVIMLDRKGDLAGYARQETLQRPIADAALDERRKRLLSSVDVALFTPGHPEGRPISISVAPEGLAEMPQFEREEAAAHAAHALGDMLGYKQTGIDATRRAILMQALRVLSQEVQHIDLNTLIDFIGDTDQALVAAVGRLDTKLFAQIVQGLETLKLTASRLFGAGGEPLDVDLFLGTGAHAKPGRTRLTVISTKFLRDDAQIQFWVAQLLLATMRWASKRPSPKLQAALLFDEADLYLPAQRQPATKAPMESLLKRGRSAGLGVMLATQSPGDLDYRCRDTIRTWFLGRVKEQTALAKLKPMLSESPVDVLSRLPGQETGEFHLVREGNVSHVRTHRSVLATEQLPDADLLLLARRTREAAERAR